MTMGTLPEILKSTRDFSGSVSVEFKAQDPGKENEKRNFQLIRGGISWPVRALPAYLCILGWYSGTLAGGEKSIRLLYEYRFPSFTSLMVAAANLAKDLRFTEFYSDLMKPEWGAFHDSFQRLIQHSREFGEVRLRHAPFADDFIYGTGILQNWLRARTLHMPASCIFRSQLLSVKEEDLKMEKPEHRFEAINAMRYLAMAFEKDKEKVLASRNPFPEASASSDGWV